MFDGIDFTRIAISGAVGALLGGGLHLLFKNFIESDRIRSVVVLVLMLPVFLLLSIFMSEWRAGQGGGATDEIQDRLEQAATGINAELPKAVDHITIWKKATATGNRLKFDYTLNVPSEYVQDVEEAQAETLKSTVCTDDFLSAAVRDGAEIVFSYQSPDGEQLFLVPIAECA